MSTEILFCGDTHGKLGHLIKACMHRRPRPAAVVLLGDIEAPRPLHVELKPLLDLGVEVAWIPGNHDADHEVSWRNLVDSELSHRNLHGRVLEVGDLRVAGLGGVFRERIWMPPGDWNFESMEEYEVRSRGAQHLDQMLLTHKGSIFPDVYHGLAGLQADILVSHEAPSCHPRGFAAVDELARALGAKMVIHGHHHDCLDYSGLASQLRFQALGVGLRGVTAVDGDIVRVVRPGELDEERAYRQERVAKAEDLGAPAPARRNLTGPRP